MNLPTRRRIGRKGRTLAVLGIAVVAVLVLSSCMTITSSVRVFNANVDFPDPTGWYLSPAHFQLFSTSADLFNLPTMVGVNGVPQAASALHEAMPTPPSWVATFGIWAPEVNYIQGRFVMAFSGVQNTGRTPNCIGLATSPNVTGPYVSVGTPTNYKYCGTDDLGPSYTNVGLFDPQIFSGNGRVWMIYSEQIGNNRSFSKIRIRQVDPATLGFIGAAQTVISLTDVSSLLTSTTSNDQIENPTVLYIHQADDHTVFNMAFSLGNWQTGNYSTWTTGLSIQGNGSLFTTYGNGHFIRDTFATAKVKNSVGVSGRGGLSAIQNMPGNQSAVGVMHGSLTGSTTPRTAFFVNLSNQ